MAASPPTKPPRGVKQGKETSGLLMSVIRTLSASETNEQREKERAKLEKEYKKSDARLDELVAAHASEIMEVMQKFTTASNALSAWGQHCDAAVARLSTCRNLLQLRRDDLKRLWTDSRTHHYALQMLTDIERVVTSEREVRDAISSGRCLHAATLLRDALTTAGQLAHVDALNNTRQHLENKKIELVDVIVRVVSNAVYRGAPDPLTRRASASRRAALLLAELTKSEEVTDALLKDITPEFEASLLEEDKTFETTVMISLEALGVLNQLKEATEKFKVQIQNELLEVIEMTSKRVIEEGDVDIEGSELCEQDGDIQLGGANETGRPLARLLYCLTDEFIAIATRNGRLIQLWRAALQKHHITESCLHTDQHYWSAVQQVMQLLLTEYLEIESVTLEAQRTNLNPAVETGQSLKLTDYFAKKKVPRRREKLFKFTGVVGAPVAAGSARRTRGALVCRAARALLPAALPALAALATHIEHTTDVSECSLRAFISDYVRCGEAARLAAAARAGVDDVMRADAAWRHTTDSECPIFVVVSRAWSHVEHVCACVRACGACGGAAAARATLPALAALAHHARAAPAMPDGRAARWLRDDDIVRFLQSLPNWKLAIGDNCEDKPSQQELEQAYSREAEILGSSLGDGVVSKNEIVSDLNALTHVALFFNSMEWISANVRRLPSVLTSTGTIKLEPKFIEDLAAAAEIFTELAHKSLLFLHLELRIECFHYVCGNEGGAEGAGRLAAALQAFHRHASHILPPHALQYIVYGLGEMMSAGLSAAAAAAGGGGASLARLRNCLAAIGAPHSGLVFAQARLALLDATPEEIIKSIKEKGPQFSELEYLNIFKVIGTKRGISQSEMKMYLKQLSSALGHIGVTV